MDDDDLMWDDQDADGGDDGQEEDDDPEVQMENQYFEAKDIAEGDKEAGIEAFQNVLSMETEKTKWGFKSLKRICKLSYELKKYEQVTKNFTKLLTYTKSAVTLNDPRKL